MGKGLKYVSEFTFPSDKGYSGSAGKTMVKGYARGGAADIKQDKALVKEAVQKHERAKHPGEPMTKLAKGGMAECNMAKGGLKDTVRNEREELNRVEAKRRDAGQEVSRVRSEMRRDMAEMRGTPVRRGYPVDRREPMVQRSSPGVTSVSPPSTPVDMGSNQRVGIAMAKGGVTKAPMAPAPKSDMLYSKKEVNAKNLLPGGKAPSLLHARGSVNMAKGGMTPKQQAKVGKVMGEFKAGELHSGKDGPVVKNRKQAIAIGLSEARKAKK